MSVTHDELLSLATPSSSASVEDVLEDPLVSRAKEMESHFAGLEASHLEGLEDGGALEGHDSVSVHAPEGLDSDKLGALKGGMDLVSGLGYEIPEMDVHFAQDGEDQVRNVAFMREGDEDKNNLFLSSSKFLAHSKMLDGSEGMIEGGLRDAKATGKGVLTSGERGVADQEGDKARVSKAWFGRDKKNDVKSNKAFAKAVVVHEMGHILHKTQSPDIFWDMKAHPENYDGWKGLAADVSQYATQNPLEFVAETFTGTSLGIGYSSAVMNKYDEFGGPKVSKQEDSIISDLDSGQRSHSPEPVTGSSD